MSLYGHGSGLARIHAAGAVAALTIGAVAYVGFLGPLAQRSARIDETLVEMEEAEARLADVERRSASASNRVNAVRRELADIRLDLQPASALNQRLANLVTLGGESGLEIEESVAEEPVGGLLFDIVPMIIEGQGSFANCVRFLGKVHESLADIDVSGFDLSRNPGDLAGRATFRFEFAWYAARAVTTASAAP